MNCLSGKKFTSWCFECYLEDNAPFHCFRTIRSFFTSVTWSSICWKHFPAYNNEKVTTHSNRLCKVPACEFLQFEIVQRQMTWYKIYICICFSLSVHFSLPRRRSYGFVTRSTFVREKGVRNPLELLRRRLSPLRMDLKIIDAKQEYNKLAIVGQYPPHSWLDIDTLESRFFKPPVENKKLNRTVRKFETPRVWGIGILLWTRCVIVLYLVIYVTNWPH